MEINTILIITIIISVIILLGIIVKINHNNEKIENLTEDKTEILIKQIKLLNNKISTIIFIMILPFIIGVLFFLKITLETANSSNNKLPNIEFKINK